jgi:hypothetical protein
MHATETWQRGIVLVDGTPVLPGTQEGTGLGLVLEEVCHLTDQCAKSCSRCVGKKGKEGIYEQLGCDRALVIGRYVGAEGRHLGGVIAEEVGCALDYGAVPGETGTFFLREGRKIRDAEVAHCVHQGLVGVGLP